MQLEYQIAEGLGSLTIGFVKGYINDQELSFDVRRVVRDKSEESVQKNKIEDLIRKLDKSEKDSSSTYGAFLGLGSVYLTLNRHDFVEGWFIGGLGLYIGQKIGRAVSKHNRSKPLIKSKDISRIEELLSNVESTYRTDDEAYQRAKEELEDFTYKVVNSGRNHLKRWEKRDVVKNLTEKRLDTIDEYLNIRKFFGKVYVDAIGTMPFIKNPEFQTSAIITHANKLYLLPLSEPSGPENLEQLDWDCSFDQVFNHIQEQNNYRNILLVRGPENFDLDVKVNSARITFDSMKPKPFLDQEED